MIAPSAQIQNLQEDTEIFTALKKELDRQRYQIELIASENIVSPAVLAAQGTLLTNKYAEGYPGKRYYGGCRFVDEVETLAIERVCQLFNCTYANVQPHSGSQANQAVFLALLQPGDTILGMSLAAGGHLTHGAAPNMSGKWFNAISYGVDQDTELINYENVRHLAYAHKPKLIIAGGSAYPRFLDFKIFRDIANDVGAYLMVDMAHFAGLVAGGVYPSPFPYAHIVTATTHKTLRGPRGGIILATDHKLGKSINSAVFPGLQGGPLMHVIAAKAIAFKEALSPLFKQYAHQVIANAQELAQTFTKRGYRLVSGGTDSHLLLIDLTNQNVTGKDAEEMLEKVGLTCNKNAIPFEPLSPFITSGIRVGTPAGTTRGFKEEEFKIIGDLMVDIMEAKKKDEKTLKEVEENALLSVKNLCEKYPLYPNL